MTPTFETIKRDSRSRVKDEKIEADALLPSGPYNLWKGGETSRRVKDLAGAFAQLPHLPKMLKSQAIIETLVEGCAKGNVRTQTHPAGPYVSVRGGVRVPTSLP